MVIRDPAGASSPRRYLPVSQPPASGLNGVKPRPCSAQSGSTSRCGSRSSSEYEFCTQPKLPAASASRSVAPSTLLTPYAPTLPSATSSSNAPAVSAIGTSGSHACVRYICTRSTPRRPRLDSSWRFTRAGARPWSSPSSIGLNVFVERTISSRTSGPFVRSQSPIHVSLRPPPYASAVSKVVIPASQAASMIANACSRFSPLPNHAGVEPTPPKLPQPRMTRVTRTPDPPR